MLDIKFGVGCSKNWDPKVAGVEATTKALEQIGGEKPKFLLIFSTIHYAKEKDGLKKLLHSCRSLVDKDVPSIGGTVTGFICSEGCHTMGVVVVAGTGDVDVFSSHFNNVMQTPKTVGKYITKISNSESKKSEKKNKLLIEFITGPTEPTLIAKPIMYNSIRFLYRILPKKVSWFIRNLLLDIYILLSPSGPGREEEVLEILSELDDFFIIGCSTFDDLKAIRNYQFHNNKVLNNSAVSLGIALDNDIKLKNLSTISPTGKKFKIKRGWKNFMVDLINDKPATTQYLKEMGWPSEYVKEHISQVTRKTVYYGLGFREGNQIHEFAAGFFFGESIVTNRKIKQDEIELLLTSARTIVDNFKNLLNEICEDNNLIFTLTVIGMQMIGILGSNIEILKRQLDERLKDSPYLVLIGVGQHSKMPHNESLFAQYSITTLSIVGK